LNELVIVFFEPLRSHVR